MTTMTTTGIFLVGLFVGFYAGMVLVCVLVASKEREQAGKKQWP